MRTKIAVSVLVFAVLSSSLAVADETENQCKVRLMTTTKLNAVQGDAVATFKPDSDPDTLEIVFLPKSDPGKSRVSDDGQVIYISDDASDKEQEALSLQAMDIRVKLGFCSRPPIKP